MRARLKEHIERSLGLEVSSLVPVSGGDIASAFKIRLGRDFLFCKHQTGDQGFAMLKAEKEGLEAIGATGCIETPKIVHLGKTEDGGCLLMEYVASRAPSEEDMERFGEQLALLHSVTEGSYGWASDNFIGSLPQYNSRKDAWPGFYAYQRLIPQFDMAIKQGLLSNSEIPTAPVLENRVEKIFRSIGPSLIHGDLWGGNYLISEDGKPCIIDPSVSYSHPGMDLGMSRLFGGFSPSFYRAYYGVSPHPIPDKAETDLCQLYYLLVHLNMFGASYASSVRGILKRYF